MYQFIFRYLLNSIDQFDMKYGSSKDKKVPLINQCGRKAANNDVDVESSSLTIRSMTEKFLQLEYIRLMVQVITRLQSIVDVRITVYIDDGPSYPNLSSLFQKNLKLQKLVI